MNQPFARIVRTVAICTLLVSPEVRLVAQTSVTCTNPAAKGAAVDRIEHCSAFRHFASDNTPPDERVARNLDVKTGEFARSIAVVIGISRYSNPDFNLPAAHVDVVNLQDFLINDQKFDEVIVLENADVTIDAIRYYLRTYATRRAAYYRGKVRFLVTFSGHGVPVQGYWDSNSHSGTVPSVGIALPAAVNDRDLQNIYGMNELRPLFTDLARNVYHFLALINACYGGAIFGVGRVGGDWNDFTSKSSYGITAGSADKTVIDLGAGRGSFFFETLINGIKSGEADSDARRVTLGLESSPKSYNGIVRLGALDSYLSKQILKIIEAGAVPQQDAAGNSHHWSGPIEPDNALSEGGFFFFQHRLADIPASEVHGTNYVASLRTSSAFAPSINQTIQASIRDDGFGPIRSIPGVKRGVDVSHINQAIDWKRVAAQKDIRFAYVKATQSSNYVDPNFGKNWQGAKSAGLMRGAYHTFNFCSSPEEQLLNIRKALSDDAGELPVAVDAELYEGQGSSSLSSIASQGACAQKLQPDGIRKSLRTMLDGLRSTYGKQPILYANNYLLDKILGTEFTTRYPLWRPSYGIQKAPESPWTLWQFTENEVVDGIPGKVDVNVVSDSPTMANQNR